jgi:outer membrane receptor protein involved in Fe transport
MSAAGEGVWRAQATMGAPLGKDGKEGSVWVAGGGLVAQGHPLNITGARDWEERPLGDLSARSVGAFQAGNALLRLRWRDLSVQSYFIQRSKDLDNMAYNTVLGDPDSRLTERRAYGELRYEPKVSDTLSLLGRMYYDHFRYEGIFDYASVRNGAEVFNGHWVGTELRALLNFAKQTRLSVGAEYQYHIINDARGSDLNVGQYLNESLPYHQISASALADSAPLDWLRLSGGVRFDGWYIAGLPTTADGAARDARFFSSISPRLAVILKPSEADTVKVMGGRAFRAPSIYEMTYNDAGTTQVVSPNLQPETIWTGELEYTRALPGDFMLTTSAFLNVINGFIAAEGEGSSEDALSYRNRTDEPVYTLGAEVEVRRFFKRGWMLAAQSGIQSTRIGDTSFFEGGEAVNSPTSTSSLKLVVPIVERFVRLGTRLTFETGRLDTSGARTAPALLWDATFSGEDQVLGLRYAVGVRNLLNWQYDQPQVFLNPTTPPATRTFTLDLSYAY